MRMDSLAVRNGHCRSGGGQWSGAVPVGQPGVRHRDKGRFSSAILPKYMRRVPSVDALLQPFTSKGSRPEISPKR